MTEPVMGAATANKGNGGKKNHTTSSDDNAPVVVQGIKRAVSDALGVRDQ